MLCLCLEAYIGPKKKEEIFPENVFSPLKKVLEQIIVADVGQWTLTTQPHRLFFKPFFCTRFFSTVVAVKKKLFSLPFWLVVQKYIQGESKFLTKVMP